MILRFGTLVAAFLAMAVTVAGAETREISGTATHAARIALPPEAEIAVEARGFNDTSLAVMRRPLAGAQVPLPFAVEVPVRVAADLRVAVFVGGTARWVSAPVPVAPGVADVALGEVTLRPYTPLGFASDLACGDRRLRLGFAGDRALLDTGQDVVELAQARAASGAAYVSADGATAVRTRGDRAMIELRGEALPECRIVPPADAGPWRARGNEPGWTLELDGNRLTLVAGYGAERIEARLPDPVIRDGAFVYGIDAPALRLRVAETICRDSMTGMPHPQTVRIERPGRILRGCGGAPVSLLTGAAWVVEDIGGLGLIDASRVTLQVRPDGRIAGRGGCNRYTGRMDVGGEGVSVGPVAATRMACAEALMAQEQRFFDALGRVRRFDIDATGALIMMAGGEVVLRARR
ncbi:MAG: META domain-containing protein [Roseovarius sp.]|nr:META domain-containing protein [Roseovarius sp.]